MTQWPVRVAQNAKNCYTTYHGFLFAGAAQTTAWHGGKANYLNGLGMVIGMSHAADYLTEAKEILTRLDPRPIEMLAGMLADLRTRGGRLFLLGVGGSAANCAHAANDFRKITQIEAYAPTDNVAELTARTNDDGWETVFVNWLRVSKLSPRDLVFVLSVGGGDLANNISPNLVRALQYAKQIGASIAGICGRDGGFTAQVADVCILIPTVNGNAVTPHAEAFQSVIWHLLVSHPALKSVETKWEAATAGKPPKLTVPPSARRALSATPVPAGRTGSE